jgi:hypothetical protein
MFNKMAADCIMGINCIAVTEIATALLSSSVSQSGIEIMKFIAREMSARDALHAKDFFNGLCWVHS